MRKERGSQFPGVKGKVVKWVDLAHEEGFFYLTIRFTDETELGFLLTSQIMVESADLMNWKTGDGVIKRTYMASETTKRIRVQQPEFDRICSQLDREKKRKERRK